MKKTAYIPPTVKTVQFRAELGFAGSVRVEFLEGFFGEGGGNEGFFGEGGGSEGYFGEGGGTEGFFGEGGGTEGF